MKPRNKEDVKPFDLELAKAGHPICQRNGNSARVSIWDVKHPRYVLCGVYENEDGFENTASWMASGKYDNLQCGESFMDLVLAPLGYCQDKPVFSGDELQDVHGQKKIIKPNEWANQFGAYTWPRKEPVMPKLCVGVDKIKYIPEIMANMQWKELFDIANPVLSFVLTYQTDEVIDYLVESGKVVRVQS